MFFFFFQAEDGIRDRDVTGVQTCALPIYLVSHELSDASRPRGLYVAPDERISIMVNEEDHIRLQSLVSGLMLGEAWALRSEERRVGKEGRCRWGPYRDKKNEEMAVGRRAR